MKSPQSLPQIGLPALATFVVGVSLLFLNLDGYPIHIYSRWDGVGSFHEDPINTLTSGVNPTAHWSHGWPICCAHRSPVSAGKSIPGVGLLELEMVHVRMPGHTLSLSSPFPVDNAYWLSFSSAAALVDVAFASLLLAGTFVSTKAWFDRLGWRLRFSVRFLLVAFIVATLVLTFRHWIFPTRYTLEGMALACVLFATISTFTWAIYFIARGRQ